MRTDLHFHLLPGVDDGPDTMEESLQLAVMAVADGTGTVVCTPHARVVDLLTVPERVRALGRQLRDAGIPLRVLPGSELGQQDVGELSDEELEVAAQGAPGRRWVLLEAPLQLDASGLLDASAELGERGYGLLIGHPERCPSLMALGGGLEQLLGAGARLQINGSSLTGAHGKRARRWALELAEAHPDSAIASDAHRPSRGPVLSQAVAELVQSGMAPEAAERMVSGTPRALLEEGLPAAAPAVPRARRAL